MFGDRVTEARLRCFGHVQWRDKSLMERKVVLMKLSAKQDVAMDVAREDMKMMGVMK